MDSELEDFISHLDDALPLTPNQRMNEIWEELEEYFDKAAFNIEEFLDELFPPVHQLPSTVGNDIPIAEPSAQVRMEELFKSFAISEKFYSDLIPDPVLDLKGKSLAPTEFLLNTIRARQIKLNCPHFDHPLKDISSGDTALFGNDYVSQFDADILPSLPLLQSKNDWHTILGNQEIFPGITIDELIHNVTANCSKSEILPPRNEMISAVKQLFKNLNSFMGRLSVELGDHKFFDAAQFDEIVEKTKREILTLEKASSRDVLLKWMEVVTRNFVDINNRRRQIEEKVSRTIIERAVEVFCGEKENDIICAGMRGVYADCGLNFGAEVLSDLKGRLKAVKSAPGKGITCCANITTPSSSTELAMELLVSEYVNSINQKAIQCASISTVQQFDDVKKTCLSDVLKTFEAKVKDLPFRKRDDLRELLNTKLDFESNNNRTEFMKKSQKVVGLSSLSSACRRSHSVGIHFGFETLSVSYLNQGNNNFRTIYGPVANFASFAPQGVFIGPIPTENGSLCLKDLLTNSKVDRLHDTTYRGMLNVRAIIALMLMQIDKMVKRSLHTMTQIQYVMAIPSCLNDVMQQTFKAAAEIADISCNLVREQCALVTNFIHLNDKVIVKSNDDFLIAMIGPNEACDSVVYEISKKKGESRTIEVIHVTGSEAKSSFLGFSKSSGLEVELQKMKIEYDKRYRFFICSSETGNVVPHIKNQFRQSKVHLMKLNSKELANGAAVLASVVKNSDSSMPIDFRRIASIKRPKRYSSDVKYRLNHYADGGSTNAMESAQLRSLIDYQTEEFAKCKATTKQFLMGKLKDLEESHVSKNKKDKFRQELDKDLEAVDKEVMYDFVVKGFILKWENKFS